MRGESWEIKYILYACDTGLMVESRDIGDEFDEVCGRMGLKINLSKSKVLVVKEDQKMSEWGGDKKRANFNTWE